MSYRVSDPIFIELRKLIKALSTEIQNVLAFAGRQASERHNGSIKLAMQIVP